MIGRSSVSTLACHASAGSRKVQRDEIRPTFTTTKRRAGEAYPCRAASNDGDFSSD